MFCFRTLHAASLLLKRIGWKFSVCKVSFPFALIHPLRFARPPVSGGQSAGAVGGGRTLHAASLLLKWFGLKFSVYKVSFPFVTNCPPETGATRSIATEGVDNILHLSPFPFPLSPFFFPLSPFTSLVQDTECGCGRWSGAWPSGPAWHFLYPGRLWAHS